MQVETRYKHTTMGKRKGHPTIRTENLVTLTDFHSPISALTRDCLMSGTANPGGSQSVNNSARYVSPVIETQYLSLPLVGKIARGWISRLFSRKKKDDVPTPPPKLRIGRTSSFAELSSPVLEHTQRTGNLSEHSVSDALLVCRM
ncbi:hypothetical protein V8B97DRAFT_716203 [Scleroderma yunnanense]